MNDDNKKMQLWEHLEELRWTIFKICGTLLIAAVIAFFYVDSILELLLWPVKTIQKNNPDFILRQIYTGPFDAVMIKMKTSLLAAIAVSYPIVLYFIWSFIRPGVKKSESTTFLWIVIPGTLSFLLGGVFGYLLISPIFSILLSFSMPSAENYWTIKDLINFMFYWFLGAGMLFEIPLGMVILTRIGVIEVVLLKKARPYFAIAAFLLAAIITPPDPITMLIVGLPLIFLYETGIMISSFQLNKTNNNT
ncbi:MAG: twin-arginine translocase subunit TatC [Planctomycetota bacterium]